MPGAVFDHDDGISARGDWRARHDFHRFTGIDDAGEGFSGAHLSDQPKAAGDIGGLDGEPVANRAIKGRIIAIGGDILGKNSELGFVESYRFDFGFEMPGADFAQDARAGFGKGEWGHAHSLFVPQRDHRVDP
jgi:hypothetical protein